MSLRWECNCESRETHERICVNLRASAVDELSLPASTLCLHTGRPLPAERPGSVTAGQYCRTWNNTAIPPFTAPSLFARHSSDESFRGNAFRLQCHSRSILLTRPRRQSQQDDTSGNVHRSTCPKLHDANRPCHTLFRSQRVHQTVPDRHRIRVVLVD